MESNIFKDTPIGARLSLLINASQQYAASARPPSTCPTWRPGASTAIGSSA